MRSLMVGLVVLVACAIATPAKADHASYGFSFAYGSGGYGVGFSYGRGYYRPAPVVVAPPVPVVVAPPAPVVVAPATPVVVAPAPAPVVVAPAPVVVAPVVVAPRVYYSYPAGRYSRFHYYHHR